VIPRRAAATEPDDPGGTGAVTAGGAGDLQGDTTDAASDPDSGTAAGAGWMQSSPYAAALACLPGAGPGTLVALLREWTPEEAWRRIRAGRLVPPRQQGPRGSAQLHLGLQRGSRSVAATQSDPRCRDVIGLSSERSWEIVARQLDPPGWWSEFAASGIGVTWVGHPLYPVALLEDPQPAGVLFWRGSLQHLQRLCVAIVGTRRATPDGRSVAFEMGRDLAAAGICVVSGLALGIDGAAHAGALSCGHGAESPDDGATAGSPTPAPPAGVAASGVDVPYPRRHAGLWNHVAKRGVMLSETPPGRPAQAWRFPARNRIIAALSRMVVVVESHEAGGSLITAEAAVARGIDVRAVPGPVRSPASAGSNQLLHDGPAPVRNAQDVLDGLGIFLSSPLRSSRPGPDSGGRRGEAALDSETRAVLDAVLWRPSSISRIVDRSHVTVAAAARALDCLEAAGWVERHGDWWSRRARSSRGP
jgi:DNA processing protein